MNVVATHAGYSALHVSSMLLHPQQIFAAQLFPLPIHRPKPGLVGVKDPHVIKSFIPHSPDLLASLQCYWRCAAPVTAGASARATSVGFPAMHIPNPDWTVDCLRGRLMVALRARGVAQTGSASEWGSEGRRFKSSRPDHYNLMRASSHGMLVVRRCQNRSSKM